MKKSLVITGLITCGVILFRTALFNCCVTYREIGEREVLPLKSELVMHCDFDIRDLENLTDEVMELVYSQLEFTEKSNSNPNEVFQSHQANCVGYSALYCALGQHYSEKQQDKSRFRFKHKVAHIEVLGIDVHSYFSSSFFKDHDYVEVEDVLNGTSECFDPSLYYYLFIQKVNCKR